MGGIGKSTFREIKSSFGRFMAILAIIALGVGFFAGLKVAKEGMTKTVRKYLDDHAFFDFRLLSTLGFEQEDVDGLKSAADVEVAEGAVSFDILYRLENGHQGVAKTYSITEEVNTLKLVAGRMPENGGECVADSNRFDEAALGSTLYLSEDNEEEDLEHFSCKEYKIVGIAQSPLYLQYERDNTSLGTGKTDCFLYLAPEGFDTDFFTEIYVRFHQDYELYSNEYKDFIDTKTPLWEELAAKAGRRRYEDIVREAEEELAEAEEELEEKKAEGEARLREAAEELAEAGKEIAEGEQALKDGEKEIADGERTVREKEAELEKGRQTIADSQKELSDGENTLAEKERELEEGERQLAAGKAEWESSRSELEAARRELEAGRSQLKEQEEQLNLGKAALIAAAEDSQTKLLALLPGELPEEQRAMLAGLTAGLKDVAEGKLSGEEYAAGLEAALPGGEDSPLREWKGGLVAAASELEAGRKELEEGEQTLESYRKQLEESESRLRQGESQLESAGLQIQESQEEIDEGRAALKEAGEELEKGRLELEEAKVRLAQGEQALADAGKELEDARVTLAEKKEELEKGKQEYEDGLAEYREAEEEFQEETEEARQEIEEARQEIRDMKEPDTYVLGRETNVGYACFENDSNIVEGIANLFPVFFFLVAALVCITTMNRMVEEHRTQIGVLKALGYGNMAIMSEYMVYSGLAAAAGCVSGFLLGTWGFPKVIWLCYGIMYSAEPIFYVFNWKLAAISLTVSLLCSLGTTWLSCRVELSQVAAALMRPRAPKAGKRVFLERIPFVWKRLSFLHKVTVRNLFRYKKRLFMMVVGISGCTALLVTGFGIRDSIADVAVKQFQEIQIYDIGVSLKEEADDVLREKLEGLINYTIVMEKNMDVVADTGVKAVWLVAGNAEEMPDFLNFHTVKGESVAYPGPGEAVISNKLAEEYNLAAGDKLTLRDENMQTLTVTVGAVYENYLYHYVHISQDTWRELTGTEPERKTVYINLGESGETGEENRDPAHALAAELMKLEEVSNVTVNGDTMDRVTNMMFSLNIIVVVVILSAAGLAFIVLYNLTNINITERVREIATVKVLGFYKKETAAYVFRENILLTLLGMALGLVLGYFLHGMVMNEIQVDLIAFDVYVAPLSYLYSGILTLVFAWLVNKTMGGKLEGISMTESLKSVD